MDLYEITHIPTNMKYVGITYKENKTYLDRFYEHINGDGSVEIMRLMETGSTIDDFSINLICNVNTIDALYGLENMFISQYKKQGISLNRNYGGGFIGKPYFLKSSFKDKQYDVNIFYKKIIPTKLQNKINHNFSVYDLSYTDRCDIKRTLFNAILIDHMFSLIKNISYDVFYNIIKNDIREIYNYFSYRDTTDDIKSIFLLDYINTKSINMSLIKIKNKRIRYKYRKNSDDFFYYFFSSKHANLKDKIIEMYGNDINKVSDSRGWQMGRINYSNRMARKDYTNREVDSYTNRAYKTKLYWDSLTNETRDIREMGCISGLSIMNTKSHSCKYCGMDNLTIGNLRRHHDENCKYKNMDVNEIIQHKPSKKYYLCDNCGTEYYNKGHIINHQRKCKGTSYV